MNLTSVANLIKKLALPIFVATVILVLIVLIVYRFSAKEDKLQPLKRAEIPTLAVSESKISFDATQLMGPASLPEKVEVYNLNAGESFITNSQLIAAKLNLNSEQIEINDKNLGKGKLFSNENGALEIYPQTITYQSNISADSINTQDPNLFKEKARDFLNNLNLGATSIDSAQITYELISQEHLQETQDKTQAQFITLNFPNAIQNYPLIGKFEPNKITFDSDGNIFKFVYNQQPKTIELGNYPIISLDEAINQLNAGKGSLIKTESEFEDTRIHTEIKNAKLENAYLAYYLQSSNDQTIQPVWVFEGTTTIDPTLFEVTFTVPAIDPKFLIPQTTQP